MKQRFVEQQVPTKDMVAYYKLWYGLTTTGEVFDYSLNGNLGTVTGAVPAYPGFLFDGVNDEISCGSDSTIDNIFDITGAISIWLNSTGTGENNEGMAASKASWSLQLNAAQNSMKFTQVFTGDNGIWSFDVTGNVWEHILLVYQADKAVDVPTVYVDGVAVAVTTDQLPGSDTRTSDSDDSLIIGDNKDSNRSWDGKIGDVILFNTDQLVAAAKSIFELTRGRYDI